MAALETDELVTESLSEGVLTLSLGRAPAHALSFEMIKALHVTLERVDASSDVKAVVLYGAGRIFCAGHDLKEMLRHRSDTDQGADFAQTLFEACSHMMICLTQLSKPTFAATDGVATAGGLQLLASCDMAFAGAAARFCLPGVKNGGFCTTPSVAVSRRIASNHLLEMSYSGAMFDAQWAYRVGLVNRICTEGDALKEAQSFARTVADYHAPAIQAGKCMTYAQRELPLKEAYDAATPLMVSHFMDPFRIEKERQDWSRQ